jgi:hypothetical protein
MAVAPQNIMAQLRGMPDAQLAKYAAMHKNDPFIFPLAFQESQSRKQTRSAQQAQMAGQEQPKVVDQAVSQMSAVDPMGNVTGYLPEDMGIGRLPAKNLQRMAGGGIVAFEEGGEVPSFSRGGINDEIFNDAFLRTLKYEGGRTNDTGGDTKYGISKKGNPDVDIDALTVEKARDIYKKRYWDAISGDKLAAVNPALAKVAFDTAVNQGVSKAKQYVTESGGDPAKLIQLRGEHYAGLVEKNPNKYGAYAKGWANRLGNLATDLAIPSARAGEVDGKAAPQTQGGAEQPLVDPSRREAYGLKEKLLGSYPNLSDITLQDVGRNVNNTLNSLGGWTAPASGVMKGVGKASGELAPTAEAIAEAARLKKATELTRIAAPAKAGIAGLDEASQATRAAAEQARISRILAGDVQAAKGAEQSVKAAELTSNAARTAEEALAAQQQARALQSAQVANVGRGNAIVGGIEDLMNSPASPAAVVPAVGGKDTLPEDVPGSIKNITKEVAAGTDKGKDGISGLFDDPKFIMGLNLLASKNKRFLGGVGEAGLSTAQYIGEQRKNATDRAYKEALAKNYGVDPMIQRLNALQDPKMAASFQKMKELEREPMTKEKLYNAFMSSPTALGFMNDPAKLNAAFQNYVKMYEDNLGSLGGLPAGTKVTRVGP